MTARSRTRRTRRVIALTTAVILCALAAGAAELQVAAAQSLNVYQSAKDKLDAALQTARSDGYSDQQLASVETREASLSSIGDPIWVSDRPGYYQRRAQQLDGLRTELGQLEATALSTQKQDANAALQRAADQLGQATTLGADPEDLAQLHSQ